MAVSVKVLTQSLNFIYNCATSINETRKSKMRQEYEEDMTNDYII